MTADEFRLRLNELYGIEGDWPETFVVDYETYANCCQYIFDHVADHTEHEDYYEIAIGPNKGLMFKNVELILKR